MNQPNPTYEPVPKPDRTSFWSTVLKIIVALASAFGLQSCIRSL